jgi:hypothetical protein
VVFDVPNLYKVGDNVTIKKKIRAGSYCGKLYFNVGMKEYLGRTFTISVVDGYNRYRLYGCGDWFFNEEMFEVEDFLVDL